jgi:hypothetical protein
MKVLVRGPKYTLRKYLFNEPKVLEKFKERNDPGRKNNVIPNAHHASSTLCCSSSYKGRKLCEVTCRQYVIYSLIYYLTTLPQLSRLQHYSAKFKNYS